MFWVFLGKLQEVVCLSRRCCEGFSTEGIPFVVFSSFRAMRRRIQSGRLKPARRSCSYQAIMPYNPVNKALYRVDCRDYKGRMAHPGKVVHAHCFQSDNPLGGRGLKVTTQCSVKFQRPPGKDANVGFSLLRHDRVTQLYEN